MDEIKISKSELDSMLKNAEQDGRINSVENTISRHDDLLKNIFTDIRAIKDGMSSGYATIKHVDESIGRAVQGERLLIRVALWGMGIAFIVVMPILSFLLMDKLNSIDDYMKKNEKFQIKIERHINDTVLHDEAR